ncbi:uncharacterized protein LOC129586867 isoform X2 [Paramacrobiotus metropolitanus]|uniref:uncharacterized protein LOC129586867 isoform X2 n=1 Tax=Paramacrobiotus metropolitanus TaxID=2943436 RepID=UPI0024464F27|nr:uncharacterized protein LOC129586867 isoform X2 [Paramacrobiotus metropolitanus]
MLSKTSLERVLNMIDEAKSTLAEVTPEQVQSTVSDRALGTPSQTDLSEPNAETITFDAFEEALAKTGTSIAKAVAEQVESWVNLQSSAKTHPDNDLTNLINRKLSRLTQQHAQLRHNLEDEIISSIQEIAEHGPSADISLPEWPEMEVKLRSSLASFHSLPVAHDAKFLRPSGPDHYELDHAAAESIFRDAMSSSSTHFQSAIDICKVLATCTNINEAHFPELEMVDSDEEDLEGLDADNLAAETGILDTPKTNQQATDDFMRSCCDALEIDEMKTENDGDNPNKWQNLWWRYSRLIIFMITVAALFQLYSAIAQVQRTVHADLDAIKGLNKGLAAKTLDG